MIARALPAIVLAVVAAALLAPGAGAQQLEQRTSLDVAPSGFRQTPRTVTSAARAVPRIARELRRHPGAIARAYTKGPGRWQVSFFARGRDRDELAQVLVDDADRHVLEAWTGPQVAWTMARGYPGAFGRSVNSPWIWGAFCVLFVAPFAELRRPLAIRNLDLLSLLLLTVSLVLFNDANVAWSVPLAYPPLLYLLGRMLWIGLRRRPRPPARRPRIAWQWLAVALVFLIGFRIVLDVADANVIDVGYSGVLGADKLASGDRLWGGDGPAADEHFDTYGPLAYAAYVPFEQLLPYDGTWGDLPAARGAAIAFDLGCIVLLWLIGVRRGGRALGAALAYAWAANPFTLYVLCCNVNDALVGLVVLAAIAAAGRPFARGALVALAGLVKFAPLALAPLFATHTRGSAARTAAGVLAALGAGAAVVAAYGGFPAFADRTLGFQAERGSPFSLWGEFGWTTAQACVQAGAVLLAVAVAFVPRRRDVVGLAALSAAVLIALQLGVTHWFYLYTAWFIGPLLIAVLDDRAPVPGNEQLLDRRGPPWLGRARDEHAHQPGVVV